MYLCNLCLCYNYYMSNGWLIANVMLYIYCFGLSASWQHVVQKCVYFGKITWSAIWHTVLWLTCLLGCYFWFMCMRVCLVFWLFPRFCFDDFAILWNCYFVSWSVYSFLSVVFIDYLSALLIMLLFTSLLDAFSLMAVLCVITVTFACMHFTICHWIVTNRFSMSSNGSVHVFKCFVVWYWRYVSAVTDVGLMCCLLHVILLPFVVSCIVYAWSWWLWSPVSTTIPWVHGLPSSH